MWRLAMPAVVGPLVIALLPVAASAQDKSVLAAQALAVFKRSCANCHTSYKFDAENAESMKKTGDKNTRPYITPGKPELSLIWDKIKDDNSAMPPPGTDERDDFNDAKRKIIEAWIVAGAPEFPREKARGVISLEKMMTAIWTHAAMAEPRELLNLRYFTLTHLHNNPNVTSDELRLTRAALAKAINSLSWAQQIVLPEEVPGTDGAVFAVNISKLGWTQDVWAAIGRAYPYGLRFANHDNDRLRNIDDKLHKMFNGREEFIHVRADWFVATATRPPLYHQILFDQYLDALRKRPADAAHPENPKRMTAVDLESHLGVNVVQNLLAKSPEAMRAGFPSSKVSTQNRLIERHPLRGQGAYWKSYDFKSSTWEANLQQFPLGPRFDGNPFEKLAFKHDGGEIIYNLPNGLQAYMLVNGKDERIDEGPIAVVNDRKRTTGTPVVVNGISCMTCHVSGMNPSPADQVRGGKGVFGDARERVRELYPEKQVLDAAIERDSRMFQSALEQAVKPFMSLPEALKDEPVFRVASRYYADKDDLDAVTVACELYLDSPKQLIDKASSSDLLRDLGLGALAVEGGRIKRGAWESIRGTSQMQQAAREFGYSPR